MASKTSDSIKVAIKVRPLLPKEKDCLWKVSGNSIQLSEGSSDPYYFDHIFDQKANNEMVFEKMAKDVVHGAVAGFNGTIFAYGQTSSGKTYTMIGDEENPGVMILAVKEIFKEIQKATDRQFLLRIGYIEIYNEKISDLLNKKNSDLKIHENPTGIVSVDCKEVIILNEQDVFNWLNTGNKERTVGETNMNERSSRSHAIFRIIIESRKIDRADEDAVIESVLNLVDLAGSERADQTKAQGQRLREGGHINKSLMFLSNVIKKLSENENAYISFRDSKLTRILQASLGGNALTAIICTIKPNAVEETQSTLNFAMRAKTIKNKPVVNETVSDVTMMKRLEKEIKELKAKIDEEKRKNASQKNIGDLEKLFKEETLKIITGQKISSQNAEKRRRTWCASDSVEIDSNLSAQSTTHATQKQTVSKLPKPRMHHTPLITMRPPPATPDVFNDFPKTSLPEVVLEEDEFIPAEFCSFSSNDFKSPSSKTSTNLMEVSITPKAAPANFEDEFSEMKEFTNLEKCLGVKYELYDALRKRYDDVLKRKQDLENDRLELAKVKNDLFLTKENLQDSEQRFEVLERDLNQTNALLEKKNILIEQLKQEIELYKKKTQLLEAENQKAVSYEFELENCKSKAEVREKELLEFIKERNQDIHDLQKALQNLKEEASRNSKEDLSNCLKCATATTAASVDESNSLVCVKCLDLQRLLHENKKIQLNFDNLDCKNKELENHLEITKNLLKISEVKVSELEQSENLNRKELKSLKESFETLERENERISSENKENGAKYMELEASLNSANQEMRILQSQYEELEVSWQNQQQILDSMKIEYSAIQVKYQLLLKEYEKSEKTSVRSQEDCNRLQFENNNVQAEIKELTRRLEETQKSLSEDKQETITAADISSFKEVISDLEKTTAEQKEQFEALQREYDDLSNQLIDLIQDNDGLKDKSTSLEKEIERLREQAAENHLVNNETNNNSTPIKTDRKSIENGFPEKETSFVDYSLQMAQLNEKILVLEKEIQEKSNLLNATEGIIHEMQEQMKSLQEELLEKSLYVEKCEEMKSQIEVLEKEKTEITMVNEELQEKIKNSTIDASSFNSNETNESIFEQTLQVPVSPQMTAFKSVMNEFEELKAFFLNWKKDILITESDLDFFKDDFEEEDLELLSENTNTSHQNNHVSSSLNETDFRRSCHDLKEDLLKSHKVQNKFKSKLKQLKKDLDSIKYEKENILKTHQEALKDLEISYENKMSTLKETLEGQNTQMRIDLEAKQDAYINSLNESHKKDLESLQLNFFQKLQESEDQFRENMKKCQDDWQEQKESYESSLNDYKKQLSEKTNLSDESKFLEYEELLKKHQKLAEEYDSLLNRQKDFDSLQESWAQEQLNIKASLAEMESKYQEALASKVEFESKLQELEGKHSLLLEEKNDLQISLAEQNQKHLNALESLERKNKDSEAKELQSQESLTMIEDKLSKLVDEKAKTDLDLNKLRDEANALRISFENEKCSLIANQKIIEDQYLLQINDLQQKLDTLSALEDSYKAFQKDHSILLDKCTSLEKENSQLNETIQNNLAVYKKKIELHSELKTLMENSIHNFKEKLQIIDSSISKKDLLLLPDNVDDECLEEQYIAAFKQELEILKEFGDKYLEVKNCNEQMQDLEGKFSLLEKETANLQDLEKKLQELQSIYEQLQLENKNLQEKLNHLEDVNAKLQDLESQFLQIQNDYVDLQEKYLKSKEEMNLLLEVNAKASLSKQENENEFENLKAKYEQLQNEKKELFEDNIALHQYKSKFMLLNEEKNHIENIKAQFAELQEDNNNLVSDSLNYQVTLSKYEEEIKDLQESLEKMKSSEENFKSLQEHLEILQMENTGLLNQLASLKSGKAALSREISNLKESLAFGEKSKKDMEKRLNDLITADAERNNLMDEMRATIEKIHLEKDNLLKITSNLSNDRTILSDIINVLQSQKNQILENIKLLNGNLDDFDSSSACQDPSQFKLESAEVVLGENVNLESCFQQTKELWSVLSIEAELLKAIIKKTKVQSEEVISKDTKLKHIEKQLKEITNNSVKNLEENTSLQAQLQDLNQQLLESNSEKLHLQTFLEKMDCKVENLNEKIIEHQSIETRLNDTISLLMTEKKTLEEKVFNLEDIIKSLHKPDSANSSLDTSSRNSLSPHPKVRTAQKQHEDRRQQRNSMHDDHRRRSSFIPSQEVGTMTDPADQSCKCLELDEKLRECQKNLFIREGQVKILKMEIKNHPLKDENAKLLKRIEDDQNLHRNEIKRLRQKVSEYSEKCLELTRAVANSHPDESPSAAKKITILANADTQTDFEDGDLKTLQVKYNDLKMLCRSRASMIKQLQEKLAEKANHNGTNELTLMEIGQINHLKSKYESLQKEFSTVQTKYDYAKQVLAGRKLEIERLEDELRKAAPAT